jgi:hypothetical protein
MNTYQSSFFLSAIIFLLSEGCTFDTDEGVLLEYARVC